MAELIYGIRTTYNEVVHIEDIPKELRGLKCNCVCYRCGRTLVARKGDVLEHHFAHYSDPAGTHQSGDYYCDVEKANESALHLMAKQIIAQELAIRVPKKLISPEEANVDWFMREIDARFEPYTYQESKLITALSVDLEVHLNGFTPDVLIKTERGELLVEICVSHKVSEEKMERVREYNTAMLEIDLSGYLDAPITREELRDIIINKKTCKHWRYYPLSDSAIKKAQDYYKNLDEVKPHIEYIEKKEAANEKIKLLFAPSNYSGELKRLRNDEDFLKKCVETHKPFWFDFCKYFKNHRSVPFFIDIPITGEMILQCDRRIWQSLLFNRFIYGRKQDGANFNITNLFDVLKNDYNIPVDYDLTYKLPHPLYNACNIWLRREVIERYMEYLEVLGFIRTNYNHHTKTMWATVKITSSIEPPNNTAADNFQKALQSVDLLSPEINNLIAIAFKACYRD